ncbi:hypothetical protein FNF27_03533 [Cafeteria roenbergensis]|uniref:HSF-type DNA-binding domain-containing protein n=1 Tax=Cafeteria roenbergensis TaxID=33653 RepID=A0A5A8EBS3_CAFRO|nr:hypothetical protein FNF27_03533 [Cafeteria roenbergensis]
MADGRRPQSLTNRPVAKFLTSLYAMVDEGDSEIIGWDATGTRFVVKDVKRLEAEVLGKYFRTSKFSSTCRQLNFYAFSRVADPDSPDWVIYEHEYFHKNGFEDLGKVVRRTNKSGQRALKVQEAKKRLPGKAARSAGKAWRGVAADEAGATLGAAPGSSAVSGDASPATGGSRRSGRRAAAAGRDAALDAGWSAHGAGPSISGTNGGGMFVGGHAAAAHPPPHAHQQAPPSALLQHQMPPHSAHMSYAHGQSARYASSSPAGAGPGAPPLQYPSRPAIAVPTTHTTPSYSSSGSNGSQLMSSHHLASAGGSGAGGSLVPPFGQRDGPAGRADAFGNQHGHPSSMMAGSAGYRTDASHSPHTSRQVHYPGRPGGMPPARAVVPPAAPYNPSPYAAVGPQPQRSHPGHGYSSHYQPHGGRHREPPRSPGTAMEVGSLGALSAAVDIAIGEPAAGHDSGPPDLSMGHHMAIASALGPKSTGSHYGATPARANGGGGGAGGGPGPGSASDEQAAGVLTVLHRGVSIGSYQSSMAGGVGHAPRDGLERPPPVASPHGLSASAHGPYAAGRRGDDAGYSSGSMHAPQRELSRPGAAHAAQHTQQRQAQLRHPLPQGGIPSSGDAMSVGGGDSVLSLGLGSAASAGRSSVKRESAGNPATMPMIGPVAGGMAPSPQRAAGKAPPAPASSGIPGIGQFPAARGPGRGIGSASQGSSGTAEPTYGSRFGTSGKGPRPSAISTSNDAAPASPMLSAFQGGMSVTPSVSIPVLLSSSAISNFPSASYGGRPPPSPFVDGTGSPCSQSDSVRATSNAAVSHQMSAMTAPGTLGPATAVVPVIPSLAGDAATVVSIDSSRANYAMRDAAFGAVPVIPSSSGDDGSLQFDVPDESARMRQQQAAAASAAGLKPAVAPTSAAQREQFAPHQQQQQQQPQPPQQHPQPHQQHQPTSVAQPASTRAAFMADAYVAHALGGAPGASGLDALAAAVSGVATSMAGARAARPPASAAPASGGWPIHHMTRVSSGDEAGPACAVGEHSAIGSVSGTSEGLPVGLPAQNPAITANVAVTDASGNPVTAPPGQSAISVHTNNSSAGQRSTTSDHHSSGGDVSQIAITRVVPQATIVFNTENPNTANLVPISQPSMAATSAGANPASSITSALMTAARSAGMVFSHPFTASTTTASASVAANAITSTPPVMAAAATTTAAIAPAPAQASWDTPEPPTTSGSCAASRGLSQFDPSTSSSSSSSGQHQKPQLQRQQQEEEAQPHPVRGATDVVANPGHAALPPSTGSTSPTSSAAAAAAAAAITSMGMTGLLAAPPDASRKRGRDDGSTAGSGTTGSREAAPSAKRAALGHAVAAAAARGTPGSEALLAKDAAAAGPAQTPPAGGGASTTGYAASRPSVTSGDGSTSRMYSSVSLRPAEPSGPVNPALDVHTGAPEVGGRTAALASSGQPAGHVAAAAAADSVGAAAAMPGPSPAVAAAAAIGASVIESVSSATMPIAVQTPTGGVSVVDIPVKIHTTKLFADTEDSSTMAAVASAAADAMRETGAVFVQTTESKASASTDGGGSTGHDMAATGSVQGTSVSAGVPGVGSHRDSRGSHGPSHSGDGSSHGKGSSGEAASRQRWVPGRPPSTATGSSGMSAVSSSFGAAAMGWSAPAASRPPRGLPVRRNPATTAMSAAGAVPASMAPVTSVTPQEVGDALVRWAATHRDEAAAPVIPASTTAVSSAPALPLRMGPPSVRPPRASSVRSGGTPVGFGHASQLGFASANSPGRAASPANFDPPSHPPAVPPRSAAGAAGSAPSASAMPPHTASAYPTHDAGLAAAQELEFWKRTALELARRLTDDAAGQDHGGAAGPPTPTQVSHDTVKHARQVAALGTAAASRAALAAAVHGSAAMAHSSVPRLPRGDSRGAGRAAAAHATATAEPAHVTRAEVSSLNASLPSLPSLLGDRAGFEHDTWQASTSNGVVEAPAHPPARG